jgi:protein gp37
MGDTEISWTHRPGTVGRTWNPVQGCRRISPGCQNCYAEHLAARFAESGWSQGLINLGTRKWNGTARLAAHKLDEPLRWRKPATVFVNSMSDLFYEGFADEEIDLVLAVMLLTPQHTYQVLTKRAERMRRYMTDPGLYDRVLEAAGLFRDERPELNLIAIDNPTTCPKPWIWLGVSVENQDAADERIPELLRTPAAIRFLSCEPLIGPVDLLPWFDPVGSCDCAPGASYCVGGCAKDAPWRGLATRPGDSVASDPQLHWVIGGCESGAGARECDVEWLRLLRDRCEEAGVSFFLKQAVENIGVCGDANNPNGDDPCGQRITSYVYGKGHASYSCACCVEGSEDGDSPDLGFGDGSKRKAAGVIELPYLDGVQHAAFPEVRHG